MRLLVVCLCLGSARLPRDQERPIDPGPGPSEVEPTGRYRDFLRVSGRYSARSVELEERVETEDRPNDPPHAGTATSTPRSEGGLDMGWVTGCGVASRRLMGPG